MVELICAALSGGRPGFDVANPHDRDGRPMGASHLFIALSPAGFGGADAYGERVSSIAQAILGSPAADRANPVRLPGARGFRAARERAESGIPISPRLVTAVSDCIGLLGASARTVPQAIEES
jgi:ureidoglycolate dehydrogenase (NAD+)